MTEMVLWSPRRLVADMERGLDWAMPFRPGWARRFGGWPLAGPEAWMPACDVITRGHDLVVRVELPGIDPERDVDVAVENGVLCISGERRGEERDEQTETHRVESWVGAFERSFRLPEPVDPATITATYEDGILEVLVPKAAAPGGRKVPVTAKGFRASDAGENRPAA